VLEHVARQRLVLEEQRRVGGDDHVVVHARLLEHLARALLAHRDRRHALQRLSHRRLNRRVLERPGADRVHEHRHAALLRHQQLAQVHTRFRVIEDAAAAEDQQIEPFELRQDLGARELAHGDGAFHLVPALRVLGVAREHGELRIGDVAAQLLDYRLENRLVAEV
jgi:hypothetical protein